MRIVIEGAGEVGSHLAKLLRAENNNVTVIDDDEERLSHLSAYADVETVSGHPSSINTLKSAGVEKADLFIAVYPFATQEVNIVGALLAKRLGAGKVIARINDDDYLTPENTELFRQMGIELMFYPEKSAAREIVDLLMHNTEYEVMDFAQGKLQVAVFKIDESTPVLDYKLSDFMGLLQKGESSLFRIISLTRDGKTIIPRPETNFFFGDIVFTISTKEGIDVLNTHFGVNRNHPVEKIMIFGGSPIVEMVAREMDRNDISVKIIDSDKDRCIELTEKLSNSVVVINADGRNADTLFEEGLPECDAFLALTGSDETNVLACVVAKKFGVARTVAEVENIEYIHLAEELGVDSVINKKLIMASRIFQFTLGGKARFVKFMSGSNLEAIEYTAAPGSAITKGPIKDIKFPSNAIIGGVIKGPDAMIAVGDTVIEAYDKVAVFAMSQSIKEVDKFFK